MTFTLFNRWNFLSRAYGALFLCKRLKNSLMNHTGTICKKRDPHRYICVNCNKMPINHMKETETRSNTKHMESASRYKSTSGIPHSSSSVMSFCQLLSKAAMVIWLYWWWNCFLSGSAGKVTWLRIQKLMISPADLRPDLDSIYGDTTYLSYLFVDLSGSISPQCLRYIYN